MRHAARYTLKKLITLDIIALEFISRQQLNSAMNFFCQWFFSRSPVEAYRLCGLVILMPKRKQDACVISYSSLSTDETLADAFLSGHFYFIDDCCLMCNQGNYFFDIPVMMHRRL